MNFHFILHKHRVNKSAVPGRRSRGVLSPEPESLEDRTPMSSGLGKAIESIVVQRVAEISMLIDASPAHVQTSPLSGSSDQGVSSIEVEFGNGSELVIIPEPPVPAGQMFPGPTNRRTGRRRGL